MESASKDAIFFPQWSLLSIKIQTQIIRWSYHETADLSVKTTVCLVNKQLNRIHKKVLNSLLEDDFKNSFSIFRGKTTPILCNKKLLRLRRFLRKQDEYSKFLVDHFCDLNKPRNYNRGLEELLRPIHSCLSKSWLNLLHVNKLSVMKEKNSETSLRAIIVICREAWLTEQVYHKVITLAKALSDEEFNADWDDEFDCELDDQTAGFKAIVTTLLVEERFELVHKFIEKFGRTSSIDADDMIKNRVTDCLEENRFDLAIKTASTMRNKKKQGVLFNQIYHCPNKNSDFKLIIETVCETLSEEDKKTGLEMIFLLLLKKREFDTEIHNSLIKAIGSIKNKKRRYQHYLDIYRGHSKQTSMLIGIDYTDFITDTKFYKFILNQGYFDEALCLGSKVQAQEMRNQIFDTIILYSTEQNLIKPDNLKGIVCAIELVTTQVEFLAEIVHYCKEGEFISELLEFLNKLPDQRFKLMALEIIKSSDVNNEKICKYLINKNFKLAIEITSRIIAGKDKEAALRKIFEELKHVKFDAEIHNLLIKATGTIKNKKYKYPLYLNIYKKHLNQNTTIELDYKDFITDMKFYKFILNQESIDEALSLGSSVQYPHRRNQIFETIILYSVEQELININNLEKVASYIIYAVKDPTTLKKLLTNIFDYCERVKLIKEFHKCLGVLHKKYLEHKTAINFINDKEFYKFMVNLGYVKEATILGANVQDKEIQKHIHETIIEYVFLDMVRKKIK